MRCAVLEKVTGEKCNLCPWISLDGGGQPQLRHIDKPTITYFPPALPVMREELTPLGGAPLAFWFVLPTISSQYLYTLFTTDGYTEIETSIIDIRA
jgi:hypothetical protein